LVASVGDWIVKLPSPRFDVVPETEYAVMTFAAAVGIDVPEVRLIATRISGDCRPICRKP
jgi:HipA-like protein